MLTDLACGYQVETQTDFLSTSSPNPLFFKEEREEDKKGLSLFRSPG
jgi:hypothetical protein